MEGHLSRADRGISSTRWLLRHTSSRVIVTAAIAAAAATSSSSDALGVSHVEVQGGVAHFTDPDGLPNQVSVLNFLGQSLFADVQPVTVGGMYVRPYPVFIRDACTTSRSPTTAPGTCTSIFARPRS